MAAQVLSNICNSSEKHPNEEHQTWEMFKIYLVLIKNVQPRNNQPGTYSNLLAVQDLSSSSKNLVAAQVQHHVLLVHHLPHLPDL